jgi:hypothetical protein
MIVADWELIGMRTTPPGVRVIAAGFAIKAVLLIGGCLGLSMGGRLAAGLLAALDMAIAVGLLRGMAAARMTALCMLAPWILIALTTLVALAMIAISDTAMRPPALDPATSGGTTFYAGLSAGIIALVASMAYVYLRRADVYGWFTGRTDGPGASEYLISILAGAVLLAIPATLVLIGL